jgi:hypothetical protein
MKEQTVPVSKKEKDAAKKKRKRNLKSGYYERRSGSPFVRT